VCVSLVDFVKRVDWLQASVEEDQALLVIRPGAAMANAILHPALLVLLNLGLFGLLGLLDLLHFLAFLLYLVLVIIIVVIVFFFLG